MAPQWDVLGFGAVTVDDLLYVDHHPAPDSKMPVLSTQRQGGGLAGTALVAAARYGARGAYCGVLGEDDLSRYTMTELEREGVDCSPVLVIPDARPIHSTIIVERGSGQRSILYSRAGLMQVPDEHITPALIGNCRVLFVDFTAVAPGLRASRLAHELGVPVVGDIEPSDDPLLPDLVRQVDHLIVGVQLAQRLSGESDPEAAARLLARDERACCAVTAGDRGCWYSVGGGPVQHVLALAVAAVDTTGCGDVFHGAYAACLAQGDTIDQAVRVATVAAGLKATQPGGRAGIPDRATIERKLAQMGSSSPRS